jgi:tRNA A37 threonylcarbamoyladenosine dehydratase|tara:strand:- start:2036 stop:2230 length:195 start_codon:yes stop_codon:yes gene_type:complete
MRIEKVAYEINWKAFKRGYSFFIPCLDTTASKQDILQVTKRLKYKVVTKVVVEESIKGIRVWRV